MYKNGYNKYNSQSSETKDYVQVPLLHSSTVSVNTLCRREGEGPFVGVEEEEERIKMVIFYSKL